MIASVSGNDIYSSSFRIFVLICCTWSARVRRCPSPSAAIVTQLVTQPVPLAQESEVISHSVLSEVFDQRICTSMRGALCSIQPSLYSTAMVVSVQVDLGTLARVGLALADPTRRRVLVHLIDGPGYPSEMAEDFGTSRANLSNHLTCLRECGLVIATAEGRRVRYELADERLADGLRILAALDLPGCCQ